MACLSLHLFQQQGARKTQVPLGPFVKTEQGQQSPGTEPYSQASLSFQGLGVPTIRAPLRLRADQDQ